MFRRADLRLHRKIAVIDGQVAYTGSLNLVDPHYFKQNAGVGQWVDAMVRKVDPLTIHVASLEERVTGLPRDLALIHGDMAIVSQRLDQHERRLERIEKRLELAD